MHTVLLVLFVLNAVTLIAIVLLQQGKGADAGAAFGSGASATVFGSRGSSSFLSRFTAVLATTFFGLAIGLAYLGQTQEAPQSLTERMPIELEQVEEPQDDGEEPPQG
ncbi:MAG: preprotein translocase subunit SecG [Gammaproteobacteria bacterium]